MKYRYAVILIIAVLTTGRADATMVEGSITYDFLPVSETISYSFAHAWATRTNSAELIEGSFDMDNFTYSVDGLTPGRWIVTSLLSNTDCSNRYQSEPEDILAWAFFDVSDESVIPIDLDGYYGIHIIEPFDATEQWQGNNFGCPQGVPVPRELTLRWNPVPRVASYRVRVDRWDCNAIMETDYISSDSSSAEIQLVTLPDEEYVAVSVLGISATHYPLTQKPYIRYNDGSSMYCKFYLEGDNPPGRFPHPADSVFIPQVASLAGSGSSFWTSSLIISNPGNTPATAHLIYTPRDTDGLVDYMVGSVEIPSGGSRILDDVLGNTLGMSGAGSLEINPASLEITSRISTPAPDGGSYGQGFPTIRTEDLCSTTGSVTALGTGGVIKGSSRSNLALVETWGESIQLEVRLLDGQGSEIGSLTVDLPPFGNTQINDVVRSLGGPSIFSEGQVLVTALSGGGRAGGVLSVVDNTTQDPTTFSLHPR